MIPAYENRSLTVNVTVKQNGAAKDITGATVTAYLRSPDGTLSTLSPTITNATGGVVQVPVAISTLNKRGEWLAELVVLLGADEQTVWQEPIQVRQSLKT